MIPSPLGVTAPVLITGARGFVGGHLRARLGDAAISGDADVTDSEAVVRMVQRTKPAAVVHLAAFSDLRARASSAEIWEVNVVGTVNLLDAVRAESPETRVVVVSTGQVYGRAAVTPTPEDAPVAPVSSYAASKAAAEVACGLAERVHGLDVVVARPYTHVGPGQDDRFAIGSWTRQIAELEAAGGGVLRVGDLSPRRDITDVRDVCRAYELLVDRAVPAGTYNVASGNAVTMAEIVDLLTAMSSCPITVEVEARRVRATDIPVLSGDASRLTAATGWRPLIPLETTLADALEHARRVTSDRRVATA